MMNPLVLNIKIYNIELDYGDHHAGLKGRLNNFDNPTVTTYELVCLLYDSQI